MKRFATYILMGFGLVAGYYLIKWQGGTPAECALGAWILGFWSASCGWHKD